MRTSDEFTRDYFDSLLITPRYIDSDLPDTSIELFGRKFDTPIMTAALSHLHKICDNAMAEFALGAKNAGALHFVGMTEDDELEGILATGAATVKVIKPHEKEELIYHKMEHAASHGAFALGMDIDHCFSGDGKYDFVLGYPQKPKTFEQIKSYIGATDLPFIIKGVLSVDDAEKSVAAGASAILVSHHHGMMDYMVPPLMLLPEIKKAVGGRVKIIVDCGIESGMDVFKALALGADAVCVGRHLMDPLKNGSKGVTDRINAMNNELKSIMARTGFKSISEIDDSVIRHYR